MKRFVLAMACFSLCAGCVSTENEAPLYWAVVDGSMESIEQLLAAGADPNEYYNETTPMLAAIEAGIPDKIELLLKAGGDPYALSSGEPVVIRMARTRLDEEADLATLQLLIDLSIDVCQDATALHDGKTTADLARASSQDSFADLWSDTCL